MNSFSYCGALRLLRQRRMSIWLSVLPRLVPMIFDREAFYSGMAGLVGRVSRSGSSISKLRHVCMGHSLCGCLFFPPTGQSAQDFFRHAWPVLYHNGTVLAMVAPRHNTFGRKGLNNKTGWDLSIHSPGKSIRANPTAISHDRPEAIMRIPSDWRY